MIRQLFAFQFRKLSFVSVVVGLFAMPLASYSEGHRSSADAGDIAVAQAFIRCEIFYKHYYESLRISNPDALKIPAIAKLPSVIQIQRIAAESLVGEGEAKYLYGENLEPQLLEFTGAANGNDWAGYARRMSAECAKVSSDNDNERMNERIRKYMEMKGIKSPIGAQR